MPVLRYADLAERAGRRRGRLRRTVPALRHLHRQRPQTGDRYARHVIDILFAAEESSISGCEVLLTDFDRRP